MRTKTAAPIDPDDEDVELDEDFDDEDEDVEGDEDEGSSDEEWAEFVPELISAIEQGSLDEFLKPIAYAARVRYVSLNPEEFPDETPVTNNPVAPRQSRLKTTATEPDSLGLGAVLGDNGVQLRATVLGIGDAPMPRGSFRLNGNAYSKAALKGRAFRLAKAYKYGRNGSHSIPAGTVFYVTEVHDVRFVAKIYKAQEQLAQLGFRPHEITRADISYNFRYEFHTYLFQDGGK